MAELSDEQLAAQLNTPSGSGPRQEAEIALRLRELKAQAEATAAQREAIEVQKQAAEAGIRSAKAAERTATLMLWSVGIALAATIIAAISTFWHH
jgi:hypothetical protein